MVELEGVSVEVGWDAVMQIQRIVANVFNLFVGFHNHGSTHFLQATSMVGGEEWGIPAERRYVVYQRVCSLTPMPACCTRKQSMNNILLQDIFLPALLKMECGLALKKLSLSRLGWDGCRRSSGALK